MESVYQADFHANTSNLTHHYLVRALRIVFAFFAIVLEREEEVGVCLRPWNCGSKTMG